MKMVLRTELYFEENNCIYVHTHGQLNKKYIHHKLPPCFPSDMIMNGDQHIIFYKVIQ